MTELELQLAVMDDDGAGCAITTSPAERRPECAVCGAELDRTDISGRNDEYVHLDDDHEDHVPALQAA